MTMRTKPEWAPMPVDQVIYTGGTLYKLSVRCEERCQVYFFDPQAEAGQASAESEVLAGFSEGGEFCVEFAGYREIGVRVDSVGRVWGKRHQIAQDVSKSSGEVFTQIRERTRPSPELMAMQRMMRANQLARQRELQDAERRMSEMYGHLMTEVRANELGAEDEVGVGARPPGEAIIDEADSTGEADLGGGPGAEVP